MAATTIRTMLAATPRVAASPSMASAGTSAVIRASRALPPTARSHARDPGEERDLPEAHGRVDDPERGQGHADPRELELVEPDHEPRDRGARDLVEGERAQLRGRAEVVQAPGEERQVAPRSAVASFCPGVAPRG